MISPDAPIPTFRKRGASSLGRRCVVLATLAAMLVLPSAAIAAVRECLPLLSSAPKTAKDEATAKQLALADWLEKAARLGPGYTRWQLAIDRSIDCRNSPAGILCLAVGRPCVIEQVPTQKPKPNTREI